MEMSQDVIHAIWELVIQCYPFKPTKKEYISAVRDFEPKTSALTCREIYYQVVDEYTIYTPLDEHVDEVACKLVWALVFLSMAATERQTQRYFRVCCAIARKILSLWQVHKDYFKMLRDRTDPTKLSPIPEADEPEDEDEETGSDVSA